MNIILKPWKGKEKLWIVFWIYNVVIGNLLLLGALFSLDIGEGLAVISSLTFFIYTFWVLVSIWRCAPNCSKGLWRDLARFIVILTIVIILVQFF